MSEVKKDETDLSTLLYSEKLIKSEIKGYHVEIMLFPAGGMIDATGCKECGTDGSKFESVIWKTHKGESLFTAIKKIKSKLGI